MALPPSSEVALYRAALRDVNTLAQRDLLGWWRQFDLTDAVKVRDGLMDVLPGIIAVHHLSAATVAADWYDLQRSRTALTGRFRAVMASGPTDTRGAVMVRWGVGPMFGQDPAAAAPVVLSKVSGGLQRVVTDGARGTVLGSVAKDPARPGWVRVGVGKCDYCAERIGQVSRSADFGSHDDCHCDAILSVD